MFFLIFNIQDNGCQKLGFWFYISKLVKTSLQHRQKYFGNCIPQFTKLMWGVKYEEIEVNNMYWIGGVCCKPCNPWKWEADIWQWLEVRRSPVLYYTVNQHPHWACRQYGHTGGTRGWLGVERWQLCLQDTSRSANCHRRAAVGHCFIVCVKCCRMVDSVPIWHTISIL